VDPIGLPIQSSLAGVSQSERQQAADRAAKDRGPRRTRRGADHADLGDELSPTEAAEALRNAKGNDQEEAHEDRLSHGLSTAEGDAGQHRLDLEG